MYFSETTVEFKIEILYLQPLIHESLPTKSRKPS